jgi:hypothetical protein
MNTIRTMPSTRGLLEFASTLNKLSEILKQNPQKRERFLRRHFKHLDKLFKAALDCHTEAKSQHNELFLLNTNDYYAALYIFFHDVFRSNPKYNREDGVFETFLRHTRKWLRRLAYSTSQEPLTFADEICLEAYIRGLNNEAQRIFRDRLRML